MFTRSGLISAVWLAFSLAAGAASAEGPNFGRFLQPAIAYKFLAQTGLDRANRFSYLPALLSTAWAADGRARLLGAAKH